MVEESASRPDIDRYLETTGLDVYIQDALILVLENRPEDPIRFLVEYFQTCEKPGTPLSRAYRYLTMTPRTRPAFMYNLVSAFTILNTAKNGSQPCGLHGKEFAKILYLLSSEFPVEVITPLFKIMKKSDSDLIEFSEFREAVYLTLQFEELFAATEWLFKGCDPDSSGTISKEKLNTIMAIMQSDPTTSNLLDPGKTSMQKDRLSYNDFLLHMLRICSLPGTSNDSDSNF